MCTFLCFYKRIEAKQRFRQPSMPNLLPNSRTSTTFVLSLRTLASSELREARFTQRQATATNSACSSPSLRFIRLKTEKLQRQKAAAHFRIEQTRTHRDHLTGYPPRPHSLKIDSLGVCGQSSQVFPKSREILKPTKGPRCGRLYM